MFSIVIPVYNSENFITKTLDSLKNQTYKNLEIILVNDGSIDNSEEVINDYIKNNPTMNIMYKRIENSGPSTARNEGFKMVTGEYVCFLDSDDFYEYNLFEKLSQLGNDFDICYFGWKEIDESGNIIFKYNDTFKYIDYNDGISAFKDKFNHVMWLCNCNEIYSVKMLRDNNINYLEGVFSGEDSNFIYKAILSSNKIIHLEGDYFINNIRTNSLSHSSFSERSFTEFKALIDLKEYVVKFNNNELNEMIDRLFYIARISIAKRIIKSLKLRNVFKFIKISRKKLPKLKNSKKYLTKKEKMENFMFKYFKFTFFYFVKYYYFRRRKS
jgi:glycosyltransferase involved in cell wall biosynthesis